MVWGFHKYKHLEFHRRQLDRLCISRKGISSKNAIISTPSISAALIAYKPNNVSHQMGDCIGHSGVTWTQSAFM